MLQFDSCAPLNQSQHQAGGNSQCNNASCALLRSPLSPHSNSQGRIMSAYLTPQPDLKIVVKINKRLVIKPKPDLLTRNLIDVYNEYNTNKSHNEKRISAKLIGTKNELILTKGSWWQSGPPVTSLAYRNILQFASMPSRPAKLLLLIKSDDGTKTQLVVLKTKGQIYSNQLLACLQRYVNAAQQSLIQTNNIAQNRESRPVSYHMEVHSPQTTPRSGNSSMQRRRPPPARPVEIVVQESRKQHEPEKIIIPRRIETPQEQVTSTNGFLDENYSRTSYDPVTKVETLDSVVVYGQKSEKPPKPPTKNTRPRKSKSRAPRELSSLNGGRMVSRELDENNTPWEVNICYIKHDPLVGCVEDESGPIYMYTAHQLVSRDDYDNYGSDESDSYSDDSDSDDGSSSDSEDSMDENKELERFMMLGGSKNINANSGTNGKMSEVYEY